MSDLYLFIDIKIRNLIIELSVFVYEHYLFDRLERFGSIEERKNIGEVVA